MVIPVADSNPVRRTPWITYALIAANVLVFLLTPAVVAVSGGASLAQTCEQEAFFRQWAAIPIELTHNQQLPLAPTGEVGVGPQGAGCVIAEPEYTKSPLFSAITAMFLHASWLHLLGNMLFLWIFGNNIEDRLGRLFYLLFYLGCGVIATYGFAYADPNSVEPLVGASGAVSGVLGAYLVLYPRARVWSLVPFLLFIPLRLPAWFVLGLWFLLQWMYTAGTTVPTAASVAYLAHVIGFLVGVVVGMAVRAGSGPAPGPYAQWPPPPPPPSQAPPR